MKQFLNLFTLLLFSLSPVVADTSERNLPPPRTLNYDRVEEYIIHFTNIQRLRHGLPILRRDPALSRAALIHSRWQAQNNTMSHSEPALYNPVNRVQAACKEEADPQACMARMQFVPAGTGSYRACCSENVIVSFDKNTEGVSFYQEKDENGPFRRWDVDGIHYRDEQELAHSMVLRWMQSSGHRANILDPENSAIGSAAAHGSGDDIYGTQVFAPHALRGIPSRDYSVRGPATAADFYVDLVPGPQLKSYNLRAVSDGNVGNLRLAKEKDAWRLMRPATLPAVIRIELEDDTVPGFYHPLCQIRIALNPEGTPAWNWESWESM